MKKTNQVALHPSRTYKARLFERIFSDKKELLELYNAVNETDYENPDDLEINTLENAIYLSMHNDISFVIDSRLSLYEHQSTYSPNLPLRYLFYIADLYSVLTEDVNIYGKKRVMLPNPRFVIFYNGSEKRPEREVLKLSDAFKVEQEKIFLELKAELININPGNNQILLNACKTLNDYSEYTFRIRKYREQEKMSLEDAVERAITECIEKGILAEYLIKNRMEAKKVSIYEYDEEKQRKLDRAEGYEDGYGTGYDQGYNACEEKLIKLIDILTKAGENEKLSKAALDREYRKALYSEYGIV